MRPPEKFPPSTTSKPSTTSNPSEGGLGNIDEQQGHPGAGESPGPSVKGPGESEVDKAKDEGIEREKGS